MRKFMWKKAAAAAMTATILATSATVLQAAAPPDGYTNAQDTVEAYGGAYSNWMTKWNSTISKDREQISLSPGSDNSSVNFAWYTKKSAGVQKLKIAENKRLTNAKVYEAEQTKAVTDKDETEYVSNKVIATDLKANTTYYYSYQKDGQWTAPEKYTTDNGSKFIFVGDPQIGSSNELKGAATEEFYNAQSAAVANDAFNWNTTLNQAMEKTGNKASFVLSSGDQIQSTKKKSPNKAAWGSEIEYSGYLSPDVLKNLPVATTVGNHDADNANYTYHFNTANASELGSNGKVGGDYWFKHDNALFIMLNTQDTNVEEHRQFIEQTVAANKDCKWRIVTLHQDIYGSAEHSNEPEITNLRYQLAPIFEDNKVDVVLTGHDHAYSRTQILKGGHKTTEYTDDEFDPMLDEDMDAGENPDTVYTAKENIKADTTDPSQKAYLNYLNQVMDKDAIQQVTKKGTTVFNPTGILYMTVASTVLGYVFGLPMGVLLAITDKEGLTPNAVVYKILDVIANIVRSIPFLILLILLIPFTRLLVGQSYGSTATIVPLVIAAIPFIGRMVESSIKEVDPGVIEAARSMGASNMQIVMKVLLVEARTSLLTGATIAIGTILGYSAMAGCVGGGGLGDIAIRYGYYRYQTSIMIVTVVLLVILVQIFQSIGMFLAAKLDKRK